MSDTLHRFAPGDTVGYLIGAYHPLRAVVLSTGTRRTTGRTYYTIQPYKHDGTKLRVRSVAGWSVVAWRGAVSVADG